MALVRAKRDVYLGEHGYRKEGEEFDYSGPDNHHLENADGSTAAGEPAKPEKPAKAKGK